MVRGVFVQNLSVTQLNGAELRGVKVGPLARQKFEKLVFDKESTGHVFG